jgi:dipeptidyl aminopeptidase/acylaminoacyl peptidase
MRTPLSLRAAASVVVIFAALTSILAQPASVAKKALTVDDYTRWRSINNPELSGDGTWMSYVLQLTNVVPAQAKPVLHVRNLQTNEDIAIPNATGASFSPDSKWIAYQVDPAPERRARENSGAENDSTPAATAPGGSAQASPSGRGNAGPVPPRRVELRNLATSNIQSWQEIQSFMFNASSTHLVLRRRPPTAAPGGRGGAPAGGGAPAAPGGPAEGGGGGQAAAARPSDAILVDLKTGRHQLLGSVNEIAFNKTGNLLAYAVDGTVKDGNGLFVIDTIGGRILTLDNDAKTFARVTWSEDGKALAALKGVEVERMRERDNTIIAFGDVSSLVADINAALRPATLDVSKAPTFPARSVVSDRAALSWSEDNRRVFFGIKEQAPAPDNSRRNTDEAANVDVWSTADERIQSVQMIRAEQDRNFTFRQVFDVATRAFIRLADETMRDLEVSKDGRWAVGRDTRGFIHDYKRPAADLYRVDTTTGERTLMLKNQMIGSHVLGISSDSKQFLYWRDTRFHAYDLAAGTSKALANGTVANFTDMEFDRPGPRPSYGIAGYTSDGKSVIVHHRYDLWLLPLDGSAATNLTNGFGAKNEIRLRYVRTEAPDTPSPDGAARPGGGGPAAPREPIDLSKPITLSAYGEYTKKAGFFELANGQLKELIYEDASFNTPVKAKNAERFLFTRQTFVDFPDLRVSGPAFKDAQKITDANAQQSEFLWGRRLLFDYTNKEGKRLQGILALPDDYKTGEKRPMLVTFYEKNSQNMHRYSAPSYVTGMGASLMESVSRGYVTMLPDIHFRTGSSHSDMLECVEAAVRKVIEMGYVDPKRIGITGHSYGGEGAAFIGTQSKLFAAVGMGAGVTDLFNDFNQNWGWAYQVTGGSGANGNDYYLYGQGRWGFSPWENPERYRFESALTHAPKVTAPFLIMHGTADPTVAFQNGLGFYNALRYNGKTAYLLAYPNEGHGLRGMANRKDLTTRYFEFFDHYLKGAPAPRWMTEGVPYLKKDAKPATPTPTTTTTPTPQPRPQGQ